ncbi:hypothetical protein Ahy_B07g088957 [Arachis hypogaea]|uniref:Aminotransferase-like plant mobile domain-containing protein n=1 Tax=Arachis hypogaea TaxID=3818 RepID=A0A444YG40_ARAHY|nr:hypothetical protein Ahy_B07g088957 [Arachis hypogaea]
MNCTWFHETFGEFLDGTDEETVRHFARAYIMILLGTQLFADKSGNRIHIRWLPYMARLEEMGGYSWGLAALAWLYQYMCRVANRHVVKLAGPLQLLQSWIFWRFPEFRPAGYDAFSWHLTSRWSGYNPSVSEKGPRVQMTRVRIDMLQARDFIWMPYSTPEVIQLVHPEVLEPRHTTLWRCVTSQIYFAVVEWHQVDRVLPQFGGTGIFTGRHVWITCFGLTWLPTRVRHMTTWTGGVSMERVEGTQRGAGRVSDMDRVDDVPDRRRVERRARVGTRRSDREWRWLDQAIVEGDEAGGASKGGVIPDHGGAGGEGYGSGMGDPTGHVDAGLGEGLLGDYFVGVSGHDQTLQESTPWASPGTMFSDFLAGDGLDTDYGGDHFLDEITAIMQEDEATCRGGQTTGTQAHLDVDLNEPPSVPPADYFTLGGTPPSAHTIGSHSVVGPSSSQPLHVQPPPEDEEDEIKDEEPLIRRGHMTWVPRRCFTGLHLFR